MNTDQSAALRKPFPPEAIGKLPRVTNRDTPKSRCNECGGYLPQHIHLDYVGHAAVTDRLLQVDPDWTWEPVAVDPNTGAPVCTDGGLWIRLTVGGVTRYGWGDGPDVKQRISDAIRNAAMRFGVALDLWSKEGLHEEGGESGAGGPDSGTSGQPASGVPSCVACGTSLAGAEVVRHEGERFHKDCVPDPGREF